MKDRILITGGAGFIGSNLCEYFLNKGKEVVCLDNFSTGFRSNVESFKNHPNFNLIEGDIRKLADCKNAVRGCDFILHQAALGSVPRSIKDPITTNEVNVGGFVNMLTSARDANVKRFIYASSSSVYGDLDTSPKVEERIGKPLSPYAVSKYNNELYAHVFSQNYDLKCIGLRYFNVFGKKQDPDGAYAAVIPLFIKTLIKGEKPVINGDGNFSRDFTYIENVIQMVELAMTTTNIEALNTIYNTAYGESTTLFDLVNYIKDALSKFDPHVLSIFPEIGKRRQGDIPHSLASIEKAKNLLNYKPTYSVKEGLNKVVEWYWNNRHSTIE